MPLFREVVSRSITSKQKWGNLVGYLLQNAYITSSILMKAMSGSKESQAIFRSVNYPDPLCRRQEHTSV